MLQRCAGCKESWVKSNTLNSWYVSYHNFVKYHKCSKLEKWVDENKTEHSKHPVTVWHNYIHPDWFYPCLEEMLTKKEGERIERSLRWDSYETTDFGKRKIIGFK